jgi:N-methylhydantoinase A
MPDLGIDTGGTFTDFVLIDRHRIVIHKIPSTPNNQAVAFLKGAEELCRGLYPERMTHGSTVATNALLERKGAKTALVTTAGFEDVLEIGRQNRPSLYDFEVEKPPPLIAREDIFGVAERTLYNGTIETIPQEKELEEIAEEILLRKYDSVALCFLHSYANPENEEMAAAVLEGAGILVSASHRVLPEYREYERFSTTAVNAYVSPKMSAYLISLEESLPETVRLRVMQSNGGCISTSLAREEGVQTILSGPAAGVVGAFEVARAAGFDKVVTFDMGGTSTDVSLCDQRISIRTNSMVAGCPVGVPVADIHTVGAGGGSIAWLDSAGSLRVGPKSAGADPGPACYGSGTEIAVTDANLYLGRLSAEHFLGGAMTLDVDRVQKHMLKFANDLGMSPEEAAEGIIEVANATMERAIRVISIERGYDPRRFALIAFGGAGPMHACDLARSISIPEVIVPGNAGVLSALGLLLADVVKDFSQTVLLPAEEMSQQQLDFLFTPLEARAADLLRAEGFATDRIGLERLLDMRYIGQSYEVTVPGDNDFTSAFHAEHLHLYGHSSASRPAEIVNVRLTARGKTESPEFPCDEKAGETADGAVLEIGRSVFGRTKLETPVYDRAALRPGNRFGGPAIVVETSTTTVVPPDYETRVDSHGNLILTARID